VLSRESRSSEKFMHGIKVLMAKNYIDNLSEEARKGCRRRPSKASGRPRRRSAIATSPARIRTRLYTGWYEWNGKMIQGRHEPLVSVDLCERVPGVMDGRFARKRRRMTHDFAFSGLIACSRCGCAVVGEIKKQRYVYCHCTGYADKCQGNPASCRHKRVREEALEAQFTELLGRLRFDDEVLAWVREALHASHADQRREHQVAIEQLRAKHQRLGDRISAMYIDKLDGRIGGDFYDRMAANGARSSAACTGRSIDTRLPSIPIWTRACRFSNWRATPKAVQTAGATRKAPPAQLRNIELLLGERRSARHLPPTV